MFLSRCTLNRDPLDRTVAIRPTCGLRPETTCSSTGVPGVLRLF